MTPQTRQETLELLEGLCEERLSPSEHSQLDRLVVTDPEARRLYVDYVALHGILSWDVAAAASGEFATVPLDNAPVGRSRRLARPALAVGALVACLALIAGGWWWRTPREAASVAHSDSIVESRQSAESRVAIDPHIQIGGPTQTPAVPSSALPSAELVLQARDLRPIDVPVAASATHAVADINESIARGWKAAGIQPAETSDDAEFVRRLYLDLAGRIPSSAEAEQFLSDSSSDKRARIIDELLDSPETARNFATNWTILLIGRSSNPDLDREALLRYLQQQFRENRPWSETVVALISAEGPARDNGPANFLLAHLNNEAVPATAITARCFLGMQVQCTQCHAHPFHKEWGQEEFWELNSFFQQATVERRPSSDGKPAFLELTDREVGGPTYYENRSGEMKVAFPKFEQTEIDPGPNVKRRRELSRLLVSGDHPQLARAFVNRTWAHFFAYGFTNPVDDMGPHNPPTHPELLESLAEGFVASGYDVRSLCRAICNSLPYQLTSQPASDEIADDPAQGDPPLFSRMYLKPFSAEQLYDSLQVATLADPRPGPGLANTDAQRQTWTTQFFAAEPTEENCESSTFDGTLPQALAMMNGELVTQAVSSGAPTRLSAILEHSPDETERIRRICLATLSRYPTHSELDKLREFVRDSARRHAQSSTALKGRAAVEEALRDVYWACLNSAEFSVNH
jgi:hypothetical protein